MSSINMMSYTGSEAKVLHGRHITCHLLGVRQITGSEHTSLQVWVDPYRLCCCCCVCVGGGGGGELWGEGWLSRCLLWEWQTWSPFPSHNNGEKERSWQLGAGGGGCSEGLPSRYFLWEWWKTCSQQWRPTPHASAERWLPRQPPAQSISPCQPWTGSHLPTHNKPSISTGVIIMTAWTET